MFIWQLAKWLKTDFTKINKESEKLRRQLD